jgi:cell division septation protein DedD
MKASSFHNPVFTKDALRRIVKEARGIPRTINIVCDNALITAFGYQRKPVDDKIVKEVIADLRGGQPGISFRWKFALIPALCVFSVLVVLASTALLTPKEIPAVGTIVLSSKVPELPPAAEVVKEPEVKPPVGSGSEAEPGPSIPDVPATGGGKSVSETAPPASVQREISGEAREPAVEKAPVPNDGGALARGGAADGPELLSYRYIVRIGSFLDKETAEGIEARLKGNGYDAIVKTHDHQMLGKVFVIQLEPVDSASIATELTTRLKGEFEVEPVIVKVPFR